MHEIINSRFLRHSIFSELLVATETSDEKISCYILISFIAISHTRTHLTDFCFITKYLL